VSLDPDPFGCSNTDVAHVGGLEVVPAVVIPATGVDEVPHEEATDEAPREESAIGVPVQEPSDTLRLLECTTPAAKAAWVVLEDA
jgi:hypothetical protein